MARAAQRVDKRIADGPVKLPTELPSKPTLATATAITAWLHRQVRYTGIEFGDASNIPWPPAETLKRGFGDCKDKATLLVALLRQAGIRAELALLATGPGIDVDHDLPGMGEFDHAIVHAKIDGRDVWIDATEDLVTVGNLPSRDQGRRALIVAAETTKLVETPLAKSTDNVVREVRTYELSDFGPGTRLTEVSSFKGVFDATERQWLRDTRADEMKKLLVKYVEGEYSAELDRYSSTTATDLSRPFELTIVGTKIGNAYAQRNFTEVWLSPTDVLDKVPAYLKTKLAEPRRTEFVWSVPHVYEIENRLVAPDGFTLPAPAPDRVHRLGAIAITEKQRVDGKSLVVTFRLDTGKVRISPVEVTATTTAMATSLQKTKVVFEQTGLALAERGKVIEGYAEIQRLIKLQPKRALHQQQLATILINSGMGEAARRAARKAVELEPKNADPYVTLGWVLRRDTVGREYGFDYDRAGAIAAYRKAQVLDPKHYGAWIDCANLFETGTLGLPFDRGADLAGAIEARRKAFALDADEQALHLATALLRAGNYAEGEAIVRGAKVSDARNILLVVAIAAGPAGPQAAISMASTLASGGGRTVLLDGAAAMLMGFRLYPSSRALFDHTGTLKKTNADVAVLLARLARVDGTGDRADPKTAFSEIVHSRLDPAYQSDVFVDAELAAAMRRERTEQPVISHLFIEDLARSIELRVDGGTTGPWRVTGKTPLGNDVVYVVRDRGVAKVLGAPGASSTLARHVFEMLGRKDEKTAFQLLDWLREDAGPAAVLAKVWTPTTRTTEAAGLAAAIASAGRFDVAIPHLVKCASTDKAVKRICRIALGAAYQRLERWKDFEATVVALASEDPDDELVPGNEALAMFAQKRFEEGFKRIDARLAKSPGNPKLLALRAQGLSLQNKGADALAALELAIQHPDIGAEGLNNAAWIRYTLETELSKGRELARKSVAKKANHSNLHTLAALDAELGDLNAANQNIMRAIDRDGRKKPENTDWLVYGRIAEHFQLKADAIAAYKKLSPPKPGRPKGSYEMAQQRLKKLQP